jgi:hypothetical protein
LLRDGQDKILQKVGADVEAELRRRHTGTD